MSNYLLNGQLISGHESWEWIKSSLSNTEQDIIIISAFLKKSILDEIKQFSKSKNVSIISRWELSDLISGASDIECYEFAKELGWRFYIDLSLHAKLYLIPPHGILVGSANATDSGLGLSKKSNKESSTIVDLTDKNIDFISNLLNQSLEIDDTLYTELKNKYDSIDKSKKNIFWPDEVILKLTPQDFKSIKFFINELFYTDGDDLLLKNISNTDDCLRDLSLLSLRADNFNNDFLVTKFLYSKFFLWIKFQITENNNEIYFGKLSEQLHAAVVEDPKPYRKEIKKFVSNVISWINIIGSNKTGIYYDRPNYSERLSIK